MSPKKSTSLPIYSQTVISDQSARFFTDQRPTLTVDEFISQHPGVCALLGNDWLSPHDLGKRVTKELKSTPVHYDSILDAIALARAFVSDYQDSTWVVSISEQKEQREITGLYPVNMKGLIDPFGSTKELYRTLLEADTCLAFLFTVTDNEEEYLKFFNDKYDQKYGGLTERLCFDIEVEVIDYIVIVPGENISFHIWSSVLYGLDNEEPNGISEYRDEIETHYVEFGMVPDSTFQVEY